MKALLVSLLLATGAQAQEAVEPPPPAAPPGCDSEQHRQFDFWVGEWDVTANDKPAGHNRIELLYGDCVLRENWTSAEGSFQGGSLNIFDRASGKWHQTWVDSGGTLLQLDGGLVDGRMALSGQRPGRDGGMVSNRISWTPAADGSVRQLWEISRDGETWETVFDGHYVKAVDLE
jgi:hypothetical protein